MNRGKLYTGEKVLVAVSGGADSVALLHLLWREGHECMAVHCNFHLRGEEADRDERYVRELCGELGVPLHVEHFDTRGYAQEHKVSIEMAARELRYALFEKMLDEHDIPVVAVAHHADDSAETFMLNVARGTGIRGLAGMKEVQGRVIRPLLWMSRLDIERYCEEHKLRYVTDSSNLEDEYTRNKIRHNIIPVFKSINPSFLNTMRETMGHLRGVYNIYMREIERFKREAISIENDEVHISLKKLREIDDVEVYLFEILYEYGFSADSVSKISQAIETNGCGKVWHSNTHRLIFDRECLILAQSRVSFASYTIEHVGEIDMPIWMKIEKIDIGEGYKISRDAKCVDVDAEKIEFPLTIRSWREGDRFRPLGMKGWKKLSNFFVDQKMGQTEKERCLLLESGGEIIWVVGRRVDDRVKVTEGTKSIIRLTIK
ncbi:MAG: tRNA lysidine(34) synthetase TilS [Bacteroidia bacterium]|nr:tRNA lysidine(34) synthetase TilS [Bacteroidia bacterium]